MKALIFASALGVASATMTGTAEAGHGHHGHHGHHHRHVTVPRVYFPRPIYASPVVPLYQPPVYHDTTHLDYHPPTLYRHGSHFHVMPGHYDVHRSGHWHY